MQKINTILQSYVKNRLINKSGRPPPSRSTKASIAYVVRSNFNLICIA